MDDLTEHHRDSAPKHDFPDTSSRAVKEGAAPALSEMGGTRQETARAELPNFPEMPRPGGRDGAAFPETPRPTASESPKFPEMPRSEPSGESGAAFPEAPQSPAAAPTQAFPEMPRPEHGQHSFPDVDRHEGGTDHPAFPSLGDGRASEDSPAFPGEGEERQDVASGLREVVGTMQAMARSTEQMVAVLQQIQRGGMGGNSTPGMQQTYQRPSFVWNADEEGFAAASPSADVSNKSGQRGAGGYGHGSGGSDKVDFLEPGKHRP